MAKKSDKAEEADTTQNGWGEAAAALIVYGIDKVCERIADGVSYARIAKEAGVSIGSLSTWIAVDPERSARAREVRIATARLWDEKAEKVVRQATDALSLAKAKELAHHYRWRASKIAPRDYGDKVALTDPDGKALAPVVFNINGREPEPRED